MPNKKMGKWGSELTAVSLISSLGHPRTFGVFSLGEQGQILSVDPEGARLLGGDSGPNPQASLAALPGPLASIVRESLDTGQAVINRRVDLVDTGPQSSTVRLNVACFPAPADAVRCVLVVSDAVPAQDVLQRLRQMERLANVGTLSASMAHEIKNALVAMKTFSDVLLEKNLEPALAKLARRELGRIDAIVGRILKFSTPTRALTSIVRVHQALERSLRLVQPKLENQHIVLLRRFDAAADAVQGDDDQLQQAFINLLLNAIESMPQNGTLTVATENPSSTPNPHQARGHPGSRHVRVIIRDTGSGMSPEHLARLFEPFFTTKPNGTGLGLPITRRIILEHNGEVSAQSQPGAGTVFQILFPAPDSAV
jgi:signal transduction histidine kinase